MTYDEFIAAGKITRCPTVNAVPSHHTQTRWTAVERETMAQHKPRNKGWQRALNTAQRKNLGPA